MASGEWRLLGGVGDVGGMLGASGGVRGVLGAGRDHRYSGIEGV